MTDREPGERSPESGAPDRTDGERALQEELDRETKEGGDVLGDTAANRNLTGSSTWETLPPEAPASGDTSDEPETS